MRYNRRVRNIKQVLEIKMALSSNAARVCQDTLTCVTVVLVIACFSSCTYLQHRDYQDAQIEEIKLEQKIIELQILKELN